MITVIKPGRPIPTRYEQEQERAVCRMAAPHAHPRAGLCRGILDYVYSNWWKCRTCDQWVTVEHL